MKEGSEKKRPLEGPPPSEPKKIKFQHPGTKEEHTGTEKERDQKMAQWWSEIAASSTASASNPAGGPPQPLAPQMMAIPEGTPVTPMHVPIDNASGVPLPPFGFPPPVPPGYFYGPPPAGTMPAATMPVQPGQSP